MNLLARFMVIFCSTWSADSRDGVFNAFVNTPLQICFTIVPTSYRSRVFSVISFLAQIATL
jgi:hypothetical protein